MSPSNTTLPLSGMSSTRRPSGQGFLPHHVPQKIFFSISFWFNERHSAGQPQITAKGINKAYKNKNQLKITVDLQDGRTVFLLVHKFVSAVFERFGVIDEETISCAITESNSQKKRQREKQQHAQGNTAPSIMIPGIARPKLLQGYPVTSSFEKFMNRALHEITSLAVIINARDVLPENHELDAWIPDLGIAFEWDAGGDDTHPPERREHKDRLAKDMGITVYHVNPTRRYPMQFIVANVRRVVRAAEKRLAKRLLDK